MSQGCVRARAAVCEASLSAPAKNAKQPACQESRTPSARISRASHELHNRPTARGQEQGQRGRCLQRGMLRKDLEETGSSPGHGMFPALGLKQKPHSEGACSVENKPCLSPCLVTGAYQGEPRRCGAPGIELRAGHSCQAGPCNPPSHLSLACGRARSVCRARRRGDKSSSLFAAQNRAAGEGELWAGTQPIPTAYRLALVILGGRRPLIGPFPRRALQKKPSPCPLSYVTAACFSFRPQFRDLRPRAAFLFFFLKR